VRDGRRATTRGHSPAVAVSSLVTEAEPRCLGIYCQVRTTGTGAHRRAPDVRRYAVRGPEERTRAEEYHGRETVKQSTRAAHEEFTGELEAKAELADADLRDPSLYINRELSMLDFFERVLESVMESRISRCRL
jgi:hypothetical protein